MEIISQKYAEKGKGRKVCAGFCAMQEGGLGPPSCMMYLLLQFVQTFNAALAAARRAIGTL